MRSMLFGLGILKKIIFSFLLFLLAYLLLFMGRGREVLYLSLAFAALSVFLAYAKRGLGGALEYIRLSFGGRSPLEIAVFSLATYIGCIGVSLLAVLIFGFFGRLDTHLAHEKILGMPKEVFVIAVTFAPLGEEMFFRGYLLRALEGYFGAGRWVFAAALSSSVFAIMHAYYGSLTQIAAAFLVGMVFCASVRQSGSILPSVLAHSLFNLTSIIGMVFA